MTTVELGACEWFVWDLRRSNLLDRSQLDQIIGEFLRRSPRAEPSDLAQYLVEQEILTPFQAERLLQSKTQGLVLGPYTLMDALGTGSMGTVYKARSKNDSEWYAVKVLPRRSMWNVRIARRQVRAFEQCKHPAVVPFVDVGTSGSTHYLAWPLVEGETLDKLVERTGMLSPDLAALYALQTAQGLDACHQHNLIHGLLKPSNILIGTDQQVRILDYGIGLLLANSESESLVDTMSTANSLTSGLDCASPECIMDPSQRTPAGDQYSLGCVLYFCLTGHYPFPDGTAVEKMMAHQTKQPQPIREFNPGVSDALLSIVDRLMQKAPDARFANSAEVVEALQPLAPSPAVLGVRANLNKVARPESAAPAKTSPRPERVNGTRPTAPSDSPAPRAPEARPALPTRKSLREETPPAAIPVHAEAPRPTSLRSSQGFTLDQKPPRQSLEERFGLFGLLAVIGITAGITWLVSFWFMR